MPIDTAVYAELKASGAFGAMSLDVDEDEHSLELHTPYIMAAMAGHPFTLVPIMVGALSRGDEATYGECSLLLCFSLYFASVAGPNKHW